MNIHRLGQLCAYAGSILGWLLLIVFAVHQYLPRGMKDIVPGVVSVLLGAILAYVFGLKAYFRRRENEQILRHYVENGFEKVVAYLSHGKKIFDKNTEKASYILSKLQENHTNKPNKVTFETIDYDWSIIVATHRTNELIGHEVVHDWLLEFTADINATSKGLYENFNESLPSSLTQIKSVDIGRLIADLQSLINQYKEYFEEYVAVFASLEKLRCILIRDTSLTWDGIPTLKSRHEVKEVVEILKRKLEEHKERRPKQPQDR
jgi:hypothetical protein